MILFLVFFSDFKRCYSFPLWYNGNDYRYDQLKKQTHCWCKVVSVSQLDASAWRLCQKKSQKQTHYPTDQCSAGLKVKGQNLCGFGQTLKFIIYLSQTMRQTHTDPVTEVISFVFSMHSLIGMSDRQHL